MTCEILEVKMDTMETIVCCCFSLVLDKLKNMVSQTSKYIDSSGVALFGGTYLQKKSVLNSFLHGWSRLVI